MRKFSVLNYFYRDIVQNISRFLTANSLLCIVYLYVSSTMIITHVHSYRNSAKLIMPNYNSLYQAINKLLAHQHHSKSI